MWTPNKTCILGWGGAAARMESEHRWLPPTAESSAVRAAVSPSWGTAMLRTPASLQKKVFCGRTHQGSFTKCGEGETSQS